MNWLISIALDAIINGQNTSYTPQPPALIYNYGTFNQLFAWHNQSIGEM